MSNSRRIKARKPETTRQPVELSTRQVSTALHQLERRGAIARGPMEGRQRMWQVAPGGVGWNHATVTVRRSDMTRAGLLRARLSQADKPLREMAIAAIADENGQRGSAIVIRVSERKGIAYLEPHWEVELLPARSQPQARADARKRPDPCPTCAKPKGEDCVTASGKRAAWPHAARDPLLPARS